MKLYSITVTARVDDLGTLDVELDANVEIADPSHQRLVLELIPAHLRKVAADVENGET